MMCLRGVMLGVGALIIAMLPVTSMSQDVLKCGASSRFMSDAKVSRRDEAGYINHEFLYTRKAHFWVGVVYEFLDGREGVPLYDGLLDSDSGKVTVEKLTRNFKHTLLEGSLYHQIELLGEQELDGRHFVTFLAEFYDDTDLYAVHGSVSRGKLTFFRTHTAVEDWESVDQLESYAIQSLNEIVDNCSFNEA